MASILIMKKVRKRDRHKSATLKQNYQKIKKITKKSAKKTKKKCINSRNQASAFDRARGSEDRQEQLGNFCKIKFCKKHVTEI